MGLFQWILRQILFPAPHPPTYTLESHKENLLWLQPNQNSSTNLPVPCLHYSPNSPAKYFFLWCHGNGCDIGSMSRTVSGLSRRAEAHALIFEYPSYGLLSGARVSPSQESINDHAERAYLFIRDTLKWPTNRIIVYGHSIGSGSACYLASRYDIGALILQSPYTSIKNIIGRKIGRVVNLFNIPYWNNLQALKDTKYPILFIHGQRDNLISSEESQILYDSLAENNKKQLVFLPEDDHNSISDPVMLSHVQPFLNKYFNEPAVSLPDIEIDPKLREVPPNMPDNSRFKLIPYLINRIRSIFQPYNPPSRNE
ncbi:unnamed protein product [Adineta ricciae]|uniref:Uncharacterized protein n=1 Tax=Adineta ricciae TaxID=249248 RepID=A0A815I9B5_ADIRI|nr:unnamed protein product [Adineta ricciae]